MEKIQGVANLYKMKLKVLRVVFCLNSSTLIFSLFFFRNGSKQGHTSKHKYSMTKICIFSKNQCPTDFFNNIPYGLTLVHPTFSSLPYEAFKLELLLKRKPFVVHPKCKRELQQEAAQMPEDFYCSM